MSISNTTTYEELLELNDYPLMAVNWRIEADLLVDGEKKSIASVLSMYRSSNYATRYTGDTFITIRVNPIVHRAIVNNTNKIQISITKAQQSADGLVDSEIRRVSQLFNAYLTDATNNSISSQYGSGGLRGDNIEESAQLVDLTFNLIEPIVAEMRFAETGGIYKNVTMEDVLKITLGYGLAETPNEELWSDPTYTGIRGVDVVPPNNDHTYDHVIIPNGTRLMQIPKYLQEKYGIYSSGLGWHIENGRCFIFPLLNNREFEKKHKVATILNIPQNEIPIMEKTFMLRDKEIYIFSTGDTQHQDLSENVQNNAGNGIRFTTATDVLDIMSETSSNITTFDVAKNVRSYLIDKRPDAKENVRFVEGRFTDNPFKHISQLTGGLGTTINVNWDNSDPSLLYPGMQVKYLYMEEELVKELYGVLIGVETVSAPATDAILDNHFITTTRLTLQLTRIPEVTI